MFNSRSRRLQGSKAPRRVLSFVPRTLALLGLLALVLWQLRGAGDPRIDDAYITFSFSKNLGEGNGPVYSHGVRVEGYSNFLWMALIGLGHALFPQAELYALGRALTIPFALLLGYSCFWMARLGSSSRWAWAALALLSLHAGLYWAALSGLETLPYAALLAAGMATYVSESGRERWPVSFFFFVAVALMRIDGLVPLAFVVVWDLASRIVDRRFSVTTWLRWIGPGLAVYAAWFAWRWSYYGLPLPTTYYAKVATVDSLERGFEYAWQAFRMNGLVVALPIIGIGLARNLTRAKLFVVAFVLFHVAYVIRVGGDWMPHLRFFIPIVPLVVTLFVWGLAEVVAMGRERGRIGWIVATGTALSSFVFIAVYIDGHSFQSHEEANNRHLVRDQERHVKKQLLPAATLLDSVVPDGARLVTDYAGVMAVHTKAAVIDMWGLCNAMIATRGTTDRINPVYGRTCPSCYPELDPEYFHVQVPLVRPKVAFSSHREVVRAVWQSDTIGRYLDLQRDFVAGHVGQANGDNAAWFLERRKVGADYRPRDVGDGLRVEYPFERTTKLSATSSSDIEEK